MHFAISIFGLICIYNNLHNYFITQGRRRQEKRKQCRRRFLPENIRNKRILNAFYRSLLETQRRFCSEAEKVIKTSTNSIKNSVFLNFEAKKVAENRSWNFFLASRSLANASNSLLIELLWFDMFPQTTKLCSTPMKLVLVAYLWWLSLRIASSSRTKFVQMQPICYNLRLHIILISKHCSFIASHIVQRPENLSFASLTAA